MHSLYREPEYERDSWPLAPMEQPSGPLHDYDTMIGYILGYRAAQAGEILAKDIEREMVLAGFASVSRKSIVAWTESDSDLPERLARNGIMPGIKIPSLFLKYHLTHPGLARMGQTQSNPIPTLADFIMAVAIAAGVAWALKQLSKQTDQFERPNEAPRKRRIGRTGWF